MHRQYFVVVLASGADLPADDRDEPCATLRQVDKL